MKKSPRKSVAPSSVESASRSLRGKVALITGATQGIGLATARALAEEGCNLILCGRDRKRLATVESELSRRGVLAVALACDVRDEKSIATLMGKVRKDFSRIDILINSAGIANGFRLVADLDPREWNDVLATNLTGTFLVTRGALPLLARGGSIVNVLSVSSKRANTVREELRADGIRVIAILPGATDTPIWDALWPDAPRQKMIRPETVAQAMVAALRLPPESTVEELDLMPTTGAL